MIASGATSDWIEIGDRCWTRRYPDWDVTVGVIAGAEGLVVIDTRSSIQFGAALRDDVHRLSSGQIAAVVNTHWHFDHTFGNAAFAPEVHDRFYAHRHAARDIATTEALVPAQTVDVTRRIDLGDRQVLLAHLGRGHTDGDIVISVDEVIYAGDLIEESGPPAFGDDSWPLEWPATVGRMLSTAKANTVLVPGHGSPVSVDFAVRQQKELASVADTLLRLHAAGVPLADALAHDGWPYPRETMADGIARAYLQLSS